VTIPELKSVIARVRDELGDETYESLAGKGQATTTSAMVTYAVDQIDQARAELNAGSEQTTCVTRESAARRHLIVDRGRIRRCETCVRLL
jgi:hypothetical protein